MPFPGVKDPLVFVRPLKVCKAGLEAELDSGNSNPPRAIPTVPKTPRRLSACNCVEQEENFGVRDENASVVEAKAKSAKTEVRILIEIVDDG
jgi:hypothetical protein